MTPLQATSPNVHSNHVNGVHGSSVIKVAHYINSEACNSLPGTANMAIQGFTHEDKLTDEHGTYDAYASPQTVDHEIQTMTSGETLVLQKMNTVPVPYSTDNDDWEN